jgi:hypothetical protein
VVLLTFAAGKRHRLAGAHRDGRLTRPPARKASRANRPASGLLKNAVVAFFNLTKCGAKLRTKAQNNDLRRYFVIASMRCRSPLNKSTGC